MPNLADDPTPSPVLDAADDGLGGRVGGDFDYTNPAVGDEAADAIVSGELREVTEQVAKYGGQGFKTFDAFKAAYSPAGPGQAWHHIVGQTSSNIERFGAEAIHNTGNLVKLPHGPGTIHNQISAYYSSIQPFTNGQTVRQWLSTQSFQAQFDYGLKIMRDFGWTP